VGILFLFLELVFSFFVNIFFIYVVTTQRSWNPRPLLLRRTPTVEGECSTFIGSGGNFFIFYLYICYYYIFPFSYYNPSKLET
jgi:hypothetical protein